MKKIFELRDRPKLKITFEKNSFEITDSNKPENNGIYGFGEIKNVELNEERTDWFISILSWIFDLITQGGAGGKFKSKANLIIKLDSQNIKIMLIDTEFRKAEEIAAILMERITKL